MRSGTTVVFDGQSLNNFPPTGADTFPAQLMAGRGVPWSNVSISGTSWSTLATTAAQRRDPAFKDAARSVLVLAGGTSDIVADGDDAATVLADMTAYANAARAAGADVVVATTITPATLFTAPQEVIRVAVNGLILASPAWDHVVDLAAVPELMDPADLTYYSDGAHLTTAGAAAAAAAIAPTLDLVLA